MLYLYGLFVVFSRYLLKLASADCQHWLLPTGLAAYLFFVHSVGSVFVIIPAKSLTISCIAPVLLICIYYYSKNIRDGSPAAEATAPGSTALDHG